MKKLLYISIVSLLIFSCADETGRKSAGLLPYSAGAPGEMIISMDSTQWKGELGEAIRSYFMEEITTLPREEYMFTVRYIIPQNMSSTLRQVANLVYVTTFDAKGSGAKTIQGYFTPESKEKIMSKKDFFLSTEDDLYAKNQSVMYLFGQTEEDLISNLKEHGKQLTDHYNRRERTRTSIDIFSNREKGIEKSLKETFNLTTKIPAGYQVAQLNENFAWLRKQDPEIDQNILISYVDYTDFEQFEQFQIIERRDAICKKYIYEDKQNLPDSYMVTETDIPFKPIMSRQVNLNGQYAIETRGLWKIPGSMGGPFLGLTVVDESKNRLYYIEGFLFSPGKPQRELMRELECVLYSFQTQKKEVQN